LLLYVVVGLVIDLVVIDAVSKGTGSLARKGHVGCHDELPRDKGVGAMVQHPLGDVVLVDVRLDAQVPKHGVGFPSTQKFDDI
jgi:hypothetical protein